MSLPLLTEKLSVLGLIMLFSSLTEVRTGTVALTKKITEVGHNKGEGRSKWGWSHFQRLFFVNPSLSDFTDEMKQVCTKNPNIYLDKSIYFFGRLHKRIDKLKCKHEQFFLSLVFNNKQLMRKQYGDPDVDAGLTD